MNQIKGLLQRRFVGAFLYSMRGFKACFIHEEAFRVEVTLAIFMIPFALWWGDTGLEKALMVATVMLVMIVELLNTGIEAAIDRIGLERAELSGRAKDVGSAAVFMSMSMVVIVWSLVLFF